MRESALVMKGIAEKYLGIMDLALTLLEITAKTGTTIEHPLRSTVVGITTEGLSNCAESEDGLTMKWVEIMVPDPQNSFLTLLLLRRYCDLGNGY